MLAFRAGRPLFALRSPRLAAFALLFPPFIPLPTMLLLLLAVLPVVLLRGCADGSEDLRAKFAEAFPVPVIPMLSFEGSSWFFALGCPGPALL